MHKKGQSEDVFNDLIPAIVLIIITVVIIAVYGANEEMDVSSASSSDIASLRRLDLLTYLRMPVQGHDSLSQFLIDLDSGEDSATELTESVDPYTCNDVLGQELRDKIGTNYQQWSLRAFNPVSGDLIFTCYSDDSFFIDAYRLTSIDVQEAMYGTSLYLDFEQVYFTPLGMRYFNAILPSKDTSRNIVIRMGVLIDE